MAVMSDIWITKQCVRPKYKLLDRMGGLIHYFIHPTTELEERALNNYNPDLPGMRLLGQPYACPIKDDELTEWKPMIEPFYESSVKHTENGAKAISYGLSSYGYDAILDEEGIQVFTNINGEIIDPRKPNEKNRAPLEIRTDEEGCRYVLQPPNSLMLGRLKEYFRIPRNILVACMNKSTYVRVGINVLISPLEPEWHGHVVVEISNTTSSPVKVYIDQGICQLLFLQGNELCAVSYSDREGKYQGQQGITHATV